MDFQEVPNKAALVYENTLFQLMYVYGAGLAYRRLGPNFLDFPRKKQPWRKIHKTLAASHPEQCSGVAHLALTHPTHWKPKASSASGKLPSLRAVSEACLDLNQQSPESND